jgi:hypothetical protein
VVGLNGVGMLGPGGLRLACVVVLNVHGIWFQWFKRAGILPILLGFVWSGFSCFCMIS